MRTTLVIPTLNRPEDLARCLRSVRRLHRGFDEIVIVEQGDAETTRRVAADCGHPNLRVHRQSVRSLTRARNLGVGQATGDLVFFVDDDTELDERYVQSAVDYFAGHPEVVGLTGYVDEGRAGELFLWRLFRWLVGLSLLLTSSRREVLRSGANGCPPDHVRMARFEYCQWLCGCHMVYRRSVFDAGFRFDERLIRWSFGEDIMFSYRLYKHYGPGSLACLPAFRLRHHESPERSLTDEAAVRMQVIYRFLFWREEVYEGSWLNALCYLYSQIGVSIWLLECYRHTPLLTVRALARSYRYLLAHHRAIASGRIDYNRFITDGTQIPSGRPRCVS